MRLAGRGLGTRLAGRGLGTRLEKWMYIQYSLSACTICHPYSFSYLCSTYRSPHNRPDEDKLHPPLAPAHSTHTQPQGQGGGVSTISPLPPRSSLVPATPPPQSLTLTRRKWLESSDPGLILGAPPTHPSPSRTTPIRRHTPHCEWLEYTAPNHRVL